MNTLRCGRRRYLSVCLGMFVVLALASMLAACGVTTVTQQSQGTLTGDVVAGPTSPVQSSSTSDDTRPVPNCEVRIETPSGTLVTTATTDAQGRFSVMLAPGTYMVRVKVETGKIGMRQYTVPTVHIVAGQTAHVRIALDTGIR
ncbi:MAG TPA: carboxypeptidase-like regulatory domain-containing protein [Ktedonobacterales bacterium]